MDSEASLEIVMRRALANNVAKTSRIMNEMEMNGIFSNESKEREKKQKTKKKQRISTD